MVSLAKLDPLTRTALFFFDSESQDIQKLPTMTTCGKENLSTVSGVAQGSMAKQSDSDAVYYRLNGNNQWVKVKSSGGGGGDYEWADEQDIDNLFP